MSEPYSYPPLGTLANHLVQEQLLAPLAASRAAYEAEQRGVSFLSYVVAEGLVKGEEVFHSCAKRFGLATFDLSGYDVSWWGAISEELVCRYRVLPLYKENNILYVGLSDPTEQSVLDIIRFHTGLRMMPVLVAEDKLDGLIKSLSVSQGRDSSIDASLLKDVRGDENAYVVQESYLNKDEPLVKFVNQLIQQAVHQAASDVHIEPYEKWCRIRYRRDGVLYKVNEVPVSLAQRVTARLKVMAKLDIAERRLPQDGRFQWQTIDARVNTCPTQHGEKVVLRLLDAGKMALDIGKLGMTEEQRSIFLRKISAPQGLVLVTGPTGSGKTVTLYSALHYLNTTEKNISTVEDPVEIQLAGINQVSVNAKIQLEFPVVLRTLLRQDPDILMIGEMRDKETADIAIQAAETGHLVLSTLHANSAIETISRFKSLGISLYGFIHSLSLIIAQRLIRVLCQHCKQVDTTPRRMADEWVGKDQPIFRAKGCQHCLGGYQGRVGIYELFPLTEKVTELILAGANKALILNEAANAGYTDLRSAGIEKIRDGTTSIAEIQRVLQV